MTETTTAITQAWEFVHKWQNGEDVAPAINDGQLAMTLTGVGADGAEWTCWIFNDRSAFVSMERDGHRAVQVLRPDSEPLVGEVTECPPPTAN